MKPQDFLDMIVPAAQACQRASGIPTSFTIAQAALESSWGERAPGFNLFGIKPGPNWKGAIVPVATHEVVKGKSVAVTDNFRCYRSFGECLADRAEFFRANPRYAACFKETTGHGWARAVARAGYATDPAYADKLIAVIDGRNMTRFDAPPRQP
jgi:flagellar rod assembly protein/muramidase FlgJ